METNMYSHIPFLRRKVHHFGEVWDHMKNFSTPRRFAFFSGAYLFRGKIILKERENHLNITPYIMPHTQRKKWTI
jgi:hypothetical protein